MAVKANLATLAADGSLSLGDSGYIHDILSGLSTPNSHGTNTRLWVAVVEKSMYLEAAGLLIAEGV
jgi:hypothetical protein